jgi:hypothetical protein
MVKKNIVLLLALIGLVLAPVVVQQATAAVLPDPAHIVDGKDKKWNHHESKALQEALNAR